MPTLVSYVDAYKWFSEYARIRALNHETSSSDNPGARTLGYYDTDTDTSHVIELPYVKNLVGVPEWDRERWEAIFQVLKTTEGRSKYFSTTPIEPEPIPQSSRWDLLFED